MEEKCGYFFRSCQSIGSL